MQDRAARTRTGLDKAAQGDSSIDPRVSIDLDHLRSFAGRARALSFLPRQPARSVLNGRHASRFRGRGLNFEELRGYSPGDDVRSIDWNRTAQSGEPYVKTYVEERELTLVFLVDSSRSMDFGSR